MLKKIKLNLFDMKINKCKDRANELYKEKQDIVVCSYCGQLLPKKEAGVVYDIEHDRINFHHEDCFQKYEHHGTVIEPKEG